MRYPDLSRPGAFMSTGTRREWFARRWLLLRAPHRPRTHTACRLKLLVRNLLNLRPIASKSMARAPGASATGLNQRASVCTCRTIASRRARAARSLLRAAFGDLDETRMSHL